MLVWSHVRGLQNRSNALRTATAKTFADAGGPKDGWRQPHHPVALRAQKQISRPSADWPKYHRLALLRHLQLARFTSSRGAGEQPPRALAIMSREAPGRARISPGLLNIRARHGHCHPCQPAWRKVSAERFLERPQGFAWQGHGFPGACLADCEATEEKLGEWLRCKVCDDKTGIPHWYPHCIELHRELLRVRDAGKPVRNRIPRGPILGGTLRGMQTSGGHGIGRTQCKRRSYID